MAVSNAIGSNVFDILLGLGLPWTISTLAFSQRGPIAVDASNLTPMAVILFLTLAAVIGGLVLSGFRLNKPVGAFFFSLYLLFCAYVLLAEFGRLPGG